LDSGKLMRFKRALPYLYKIGSDEQK